MKRRAFLKKSLFVSAALSLGAVSGFGKIHIKERK